MCRSVIIDGVRCSNRGQLQQRVPKKLDLPTLKGGDKFTCLCPVSTDDLKALAKALGGTLDQSDSFDDYIDTKPRSTGGGG